MPLMTLLLYTPPPQLSKSPKMSLSAILKAYSIYPHFYLSTCFPITPNTTPLPLSYTPSICASLALSTVPLRSKYPATAPIAIIASAPRTTPRYPPHRYLCLPNCPYFLFSTFLYLSLSTAV